MASKKNSKNYAFRYSFAFGLIIFGVVFSLCGGILYHLFVRAQEADLVVNFRKSQTGTQELEEDSAIIEHDEPQVRVDTVYITKYVTEECRKKHCEAAEAQITPPKDTATK